MFGTIFILQLFQNGLLVLCSVGCPGLRINIHSLVPLATLSQLAERLENVYGNILNAPRWGDFRVVVGNRLLSKPPREEQVFHPLSLLLAKARIMTSM